MRMLDNKRMNSECSIWRVLIFSVNFTPGYPRRYPDLPLTREHAMPSRGDKQDKPNWRVVVACWSLCICALLMGAGIWLRSEALITATLTVFASYSCFQLFASMRSGVAQSVQHGFFSWREHPVVFSLLCFAYVFFFSVSVACVLIMFKIIPPISGDAGAGFFR